MTPSLLIFSEKRRRRSKSPTPRLASAACGLVKVRVENTEAAAHLLYSAAFRLTLVSNMLETPASDWSDSEALPSSLEPVSEPSSSGVLIVGLKRPALFKSLKTSSSL